MEKYLVIDNGGTEIKYAVMDENGSILEKGAENTPKWNPALGIEKCKEDYFRILDTIVNPHVSEAEGIAFSVPGCVSNDGYLFTAGSLEYFEKFHFVNAVKKRYGIEKVSAENDGKCAALAELWKGALKDVTCGMTIGIGTGLAGGLVLDGKIYRGVNASAGEISWIFLGENQNRDIKNSGIILSAKSLCRMVESEMGLQKKIDGKEAFAYINEGNRNALRALNIYAEAFAKFIYKIQCLIDVEKYAIGGGISRQPVLIEAIQKALPNAFQIMIDGNVAESPVRIPKVEACRFFNDANLIGALYYLLSRYYG